MNRWLRALGCGLAMALAACAQQRLPVHVEISHQVDGQPLVLDGASYQTRGGESFSVSRLRYYLGQFRLRLADGSWFDPAARDGGYVLVDAADAASTAFDLAPAPRGDYSGLSFLIGVDRARNTGGAQAGALDPARGMFWTWSSGYIFFLLEGHSPQSADPDHAISYHVGGALEPSPARQVFLSFPTTLHLRPDLEAEIHLEADLAALFDGQHPLRIAELSHLAEPGTGTALADNYAGQFRVGHLHNQPRSGATP